MANNELIKQAIALLQLALNEQVSEPTPGPVPPKVDAIVSVTFENLGEPQDDVPFTFGHVFAIGHFQPGKPMHGRLDNGAEIPLQVDMKATHADGSVRHAIISGVLPTLFAKESRSMGLVPAKTGTPFKQIGFSIPRIKVTANLAGVEYFADPSELIKLGDSSKWLQGELVDETHVSLALRDKLRNEHPHLHARFSIRAYAVGKTRVDISIENDWAYEPNPQNFIYDLSVEIDGKERFQKKALTHYHHARARLVYWASDEPMVHIRHDGRYLIDTKALPNYDSEIVPSEKALTKLEKDWAGDKTELMNVGLAMKAMPTTGGRNDLGILPGWAALYLISQDHRAKMVTIATANLAGSWSTHYRDKDTGRPISLIDYPYMTMVGTPGDTMNPATKKREVFPTRLKALTATPLVHDVSHQPGFSYLPYLVTGDYYHLEELQFWAMYNAFSSNPGYRQNIKGLLKPEQVRGQAWSMRTLAEAAYISPDSDPLKADIAQVLDSNLDWYNGEYTDNPNANKLGVLTNGYAVVYQGKTGVAPWQDDFFTQAIGHAADLGFEKAKRLLKWKAQFPIQRIIGEGVCPVFGAAYSLVIGKGQDGPYFETMAEVMKATPEVITDMACGSKEMADALKLKEAGEMTGYSSGATGYPSNMQPALSYAADYAGEEGKKAWKQFMSRPVKPDYSGAPQFAIVPR